MEVAPVLQGEEQGIPVKTGNTGNTIRNFLRNGVKNIPLNLKGSL
jgi:hypothetical protein